MQTDIKPAKGEFLGQCNRTVCSTQNAQFYNHSTRAYYCGACAKLINQANYNDSIILYGHVLCTHRAQGEPEPQTVYK